MKKMIMLICLTFSLNAFSFTDPKVGGLVTLKKGFESKLTKNGVLYVFAKKAGPDTNPNDRTPPVAVLRIPNPLFPQAFVLTAKNVMIPGTPFTGPFHVTARYSPNGDALNKTGALEGIDPKHLMVMLGNKDLKIDLNVELK